MRWLGCRTPARKQQKLQVSHRLVSALHLQGASTNIAALRDLFCGTSARDPNIHSVLYAACPCRTHARNQGEVCCEDVTQLVTIPPALLWWPSSGYSSVTWIIASPLRPPTQKGKGGDYTHASMHASTLARTPPIHHWRGGVPDWQPHRCTCCELGHPATGRTHLGSCPSAGEGTPALPAASGHPHTPSCLHRCSQQAQVMSYRFVWVWQAFARSVIAGTRLNLAEDDTAMVKTRLCPILS